LFVTVYVCVSVELPRSTPESSCTTSKWTPWTFVRVCSDVPEEETTVVGSSAPSPSPASSPVAHSRGASFAPKLAERVELKTLSASPIGPAGLKTASLKLPSPSTGTTTAPAVVYGLPFASVAVTQWSASPAPAAAEAETV
jgi:hypothetical protein